MTYIDEPILKGKYYYKIKVKEAGNLSHITDAQTATTTVGNPLPDKIIYNYNDTSLLSETDYYYKLYTY